jgi:transforming growth factor-beta-induced protein
MNTTTRLSLALGALGLTSAISLGFSRNPAPGDLVDVAVNAGRFNVLAQALTAADLVGALQGPGPFTVFAPTDSAFAKLPPGTLDFLLQPQNKQALTDILLYHVVPGKLGAADVLASKALDTLNGQRLDISLQQGQPFVDQAQIWVTDVGATNGVIHVIDEVLLPSTLDVLETAETAGTFTTLLAAVDAADLTAALGGPGPFTVLAPTDAAFAKLPPVLITELLKPENKGRLITILTYHVIPDRLFADEALAAGSVATLQGKSVTFSSNPNGAFVNGAKLEAVDIDASNGVVHVIDTVLIPPAQ